MRRFFAKNLLFIIFINLLVKPLWIFMIDRTVQNKVGHASYGMYQALFNMGVIFQILLDFGINNYNSRSIAEYPRKLKVLFPVMLSARVILSLMYLVLVCGFGWLIGYRGWEISLLASILTIQCLSSVLMFIRSSVAALHRFKLDGILSVSDRLLMILICGFLLIYPATSGAFRIEWFVWAQIASYGIAIVIAFFILAGISGVRPAFSIDPKKIIRIIKGSLPYALLIFLMSVYTRADMTLIERLGGARGREEAGIYAAAYRLLDVGNMFGLMFAGMLLPVFARMLAQRQNVQPIVQLCVNMLLPVSFLFTVCGVFFGSEIMHLLYKEATEADGQVFAWLMIAFPAFSLSNVYSTLLTANGNLKLLNKIALMGVAINLSLNFILIPIYFSLGAAFSACITQMALAISFSIFAQKQVNLAKNARWIFSFLAYLGLMLSGGVAVKYLPVSWISQLLILLSAGVVLILLFRFVSLKAARQLLVRD